MMERSRVKEAARAQTIRVGAEIANILWKRNCKSKREFLKKVVES